MRARTKFAIVLMVITLVLAGAMYGGLELYKRQQISEMEQSVEETARLTAKQIASEVKAKRDYVGYIASRPRTRRFEQSERYLDTFLANSRFYAAQVIAANGTVIAFRGDIQKSVRKSVVGTDVSSATYVRKALEGRTYVSGVEYANATDQHLIIISAPIVWSNGTVKGVFAASIYLNEQTVFGTVSPLETSTQSIRVVNGSTVLNARERVFSQRIVASHTVPGMGWQVVVSRDASGLIKELQWLAIGQGVGILVLLTLIISFGYWQYATNLRQAERLLEGFSELKAGNFDYELSMTSAEEWQQISEGFTEMTAGLKERERAIREREQRLGVLNRVLRHNLQNDMGVIINYAQMIADFDDESQQEMAVDKIVSKGEELLSHGQKARKIEKAMDDADEGRLAVDVVPLVEDAVDEFGAAFPDATIRTTLPDQQLAVAISSLDYVIDNLVENALVHNDADDPLVEIEVTREGDHVVCAVIDNGPGIPEYERQIFADEKEETSLEHGSGIGLWLAYWILEKSGGKLRFREGIDGGTRVEAVLEAAPSAATDGDVVEQLESESALSGRTSAETGVDVDAA